MVDGLRNAIRALDLIEETIRDAADAIASAFAKEAELQSAEQLRSTLQGTQSSLDRQVRALEVAPRSVRILSPTIGSVMSSRGRKVPSGNPCVIPSWAIHWIAS